jgi:hypothetical protein
MIRHRSFLSSCSYTKLAFIRTIGLLIYIYMSNNALGIAPGGYPLNYAGECTPFVSGMRYWDGHPVVDLPSVINTAYLKSAVAHHAYWMRIYDTPPDHTALQNNRIASGHNRMQSPGCDESTDITKVSGKCLEWWQALSATELTMLLPFMAGGLPVISHHDDNTDQPADATYTRNIMGRVVAAAQHTDGSVDVCIRPCNTVEGVWLCGLIESGCFQGISLHHIRNERTIQLREVSVCIQGKRPSTWLMAVIRLSDMKPMPTTSIPYFHPTFKPNVDTVHQHTHLVPSVLMKKLHTKKHHLCYTTEYYTPNIGRDHKSASLRSTYPKMQQPVTDPSMSALPNFHVGHGVACSSNMVSVTPTISLPDGRVHARMSAGSIDNPTSTPTQRTPVAAVDSIKTPARISGSIPIAASTVSIPVQTPHNGADESGNTDSGENVQSIMTPSPVESNLDGDDPIAVAASSRDAVPWYSNAPPCFYVASMGKENYDFVAKLMVASRARVATVTEVTIDPPPFTVDGLFDCIYDLFTFMQAMHTQYEYSFTALTSMLQETNSTKYSQISDTVDELKGFLSKWGQCGDASFLQKFTGHMKEQLATVLSPREADDFNRVVMMASAGNKNSPALPPSVPLSQSGHNLERLRVLVAASDTNSNPNVITAAAKAASVSTSNHGSGVVDRLNKTPIRWNTPAPSTPLVRDIVPPATSGINVKSSSGGVYHPVGGDTHLPPNVTNAPSLNALWLKRGNLEAYGNFFDLPSTRDPPAKRRRGEFSL